MIAGDEGHPAGGRGFVARPIVSNGGAHGSNSAAWCSIRGSRFSVVAERSSGVGAQYSSGR
jgi:hypothetical protein